MLLEVEDLDVGYGASTVVHGVSFHVEPGEAVAIIGSNGAGKTTTLRAIAGMLEGRAGRVAFDGDEILGEPAHVVSRRGLAYVPAERHLFPGMPIHENLSLGAYPDKPDPDRLARVFELFPRLEERRNQSAGTLSGGEQQMLAVGRALMGKPRLLILDEPTTGLAPKLASDAYAALAALRTDEGLTVLVAEQQVPLALDLCDRGYVIEDGRIELSGSSEELRGNVEVQRAYLGIA